MSVSAVPSDPGAGPVHNGITWPSWMERGGSACPAAGGGAAATAAANITRAPTRRIVIWMVGYYTTSSAAHGGDQKDLRSLAHGRSEAARIADVFAVDEDVDVRADLAQLGDHPVPQGGTLGPEA